MGDNINAHEDLIQITTPGEYRDVMKKVNNGHQRCPQRGAQKKTDRKEEKERGGGKEDTEGQIVNSRNQKEKNE